MSDFRNAHVNARWGHFMRFAALLLAAIALALVPIAVGAKGKPKKPPFNKPEILLQWINEYRHNPEPDRLAEAYKAMRDLGLLKDVEQAGIYVGFIAGVIGANPDKAEKLVSDMFPMPPPDQVVVVKAIAYSGLSEWKELMGKFVERMPARRIVIERYLYGKLPVLRDLPLDNPISDRRQLGLLLRNRVVRAHSAPRAHARLVEGKEQRREAHYRQHGEMDAGAERLARPRAARLPQDVAAASAGRGGGFAQGHHRVPAKRSSLPTSARTRSIPSRYSRRRARKRAATSPGGGRRARRHSRWAALRPAPWARSTPVSRVWWVARCRTWR